MTWSLHLRPVAGSTHPVDVHHLHRRSGVAPTSSSVTTPPAASHRSTPDLRDLPLWHRRGGQRPGARLHHHHRAPARCRGVGYHRDQSGAPLGGTDPESVESMRYSIPRAAARIKSRAVTLNDYADLAMQVPGVAKSVSHGAVYTAVYVRIAPMDGEGNDQYMADLCDAVEAYLFDKVMVGSTVYCRAPELLRPVAERLDPDAGACHRGLQPHPGAPGGRQCAIRSSLAFDQTDFGTR